MSFSYMCSSDVENDARTVKTAIFVRVQCPELFLQRAILLTIFR